MYWNHTPHAWMHQNCDSSSKCTEILPLTHKCTEILSLTHKCTEIVIPQVNAPESYPSHKATKSSILRKMHRNPVPHTWMQRNRHPSSKCTRILPLTHECTEIVTPQVNALKSYPSHMNAPKSSSLKWLHRTLTPHTWMHWNHHPSSKWTRIFPLTHECTEIIIPQVNAQESCPSHMNAPKSSALM